MFGRMTKKVPDRNSQWKESKTMLLGDPSCSAAYAYLSLAYERIAYHLLSLVSTLPGAIPKDRQRTQWPPQSR